jgi:hypothetical protein
MVEKFTEVNLDDPDSTVPVNETDELLASLGLNILAPASGNSCTCGACGYECTHDEYQQWAERLMAHRKENK